MATSASLAANERNPSLAGAHRNLGWEKTEDQPKALWCKTKFLFKGRIIDLEWNIFDSQDKVTERVRHAFSISQSKLVYFENDAGDIVTVDPTLPEGKSVNVCVEPPDFTFSEFFGQFGCIMGQNTGQADKDIDC